MYVGEGDVARSHLLANRTSALIAANHVEPHGANWLGPGPGAGGGGTDGGQPISQRFAAATSALLGEGGAEGGP